MVGPGLGLSSTAMTRRNLLLNMYGAMHERLGPSFWWPGETPFEIALGAILTQNTNWENVTRALTNLREESLLSAEKIFALPEERLAALIRPAGYFRLKARRIKHFMTFLHRECGLCPEKLADFSTQTARTRLLTVNGIGPETADSILLYALHKPTFVVDAYTRRILNRHMLVPEDIGYEELREYFMDVLPVDVVLYSEFHALIVRVGKKWCRKKQPDCSSCPLAGFLE
jgi:endonuclease-3 related protein